MDIDDAHGTIDPDGPLLEPGRNCWRVERADRLGLIVDGADYFAALRQALIAARRQVILIGWDFDFEIEMLPGEGDAEGLAPDGLPNRLGPFIEALAERTPELDLYLLKWNGAVLAAPGRVLPGLRLRLFAGEAIHFALDGHHPFGACHHQKIVVVDDALAFCGGIDVTERRWDTSDHAPGDPRRTLRDGTPAGPWHDATTALTGPVAAALGELARARWHRATDEALEAPALDPGAASPDADAIWPDGVAVAAGDVPVAIARTYPPFAGEEMVNEIERLYLDAVRAARRTIYVESQYLTARSILDALEARLRAADGPEIVVVNPQSADSALEDAAMHSLRGRAVDRLRAADGEDRFRVLHPVNAAGEPIYVHAKVFITDDRLLHVGSSNIDDRSMGFDTECDVAVEGRDDATRGVIRAFHLRLLAEHLGSEPEAVAAAWEERGSMIAAIEALDVPEGRGLRSIVTLPETMAGRWLADNRLLDPRFEVGEPTSTGRGIRPRHLLLGGAILGGLGLAWYLWSRRDEG